LEQNRCGNSNPARRLIASAQKARCKKKWQYGFLAQDAVVERGGNQKMFMTRKSGEHQRGRAGQIAVAIRFRKGQRNEVSRKVIE